MSRSKIGTIVEYGKCIKVQTRENSNAELTMYGEIVSERPKNWWTGKEVEGDFIVQSEIIEAINNIEKTGIKNLHIRMNSIGGDACVSILIHNRLRELQKKGVTVSCTIDGVAMSGGSLIICSCDNVKVNPSSLIMIHKCWSVIVGGYGADDLRALATQFDAYDNAQVSIYERKTKISPTIIKHMMSETTYLTGKEAVEKGFADELLEDTPLTLAASANKEFLYINGKQMRVAQGLNLPETIEVLTEQSEDINKKESLKEGSEGGNSMAKNLEELRVENAELAQQIETEVRNAIKSEMSDGIKSAVGEERARISAIDEIASLFDADLVTEAKYGEAACTAQELTYRAAQRMAKAGKAFIANAQIDATAGNTVPATAAIDEGKPKTAQEKQAEADALVKGLLHKEGE